MVLVIRTIFLGSPAFCHPFVGCVLFLQDPLLLVFKKEATIKRYPHNPSQKTQQWGPEPFLWVLAHFVRVMKTPGTLKKRRTMDGLKPPQRYLHLCLAPVLVICLGTREESGPTKGGEGSQNIREVRGASETNRNAIIFQAALTALMGTIGKLPRLVLEAAA